MPASDQLLPLPQSTKEREAPPLPIAKYLFVTTICSEKVHGELTVLTGDGLHDKVCLTHWELTSEEWQLSLPLTALGQLLKC